MLKEKRLEDLALLYSLYKPMTQCLAPIALQFRQHIIEEGSQLVRSVEANHKQVEKDLSIKDIIEKSSYVENLLEMLKSLKNMVKDTFCSDTVFKS